MVDVHARQTVRSKLEPSLPQRLRGISVEKLRLHVVSHFMPDQDVHEKVKGHRLMDHIATQKSEGNVAYPECAEVDDSVVDVPGYNVATGRTIERRSMGKRAVGPATERFLAIRGHGLTRQVNGSPSHAVIAKPSSLECGFPRLIDVIDDVVEPENDGTFTAFRERRDARKIHSAEVDRPRSCDGLSNANAEVMTGSRARWTPKRWSGPTRICPGTGTEKQDKSRDRGKSASWVSQLSFARE